MVIDFYLCVLFRAVIAEMITKIVNLWIRLATAFC